jgi:UDP-N-acetylmuramoylalanine--D-glutamate ligase
MAETILILGIGKTGEACSRFFEERGSNVIKFDDARPDCIHEISENRLREVSFVVQSPGISSNHPVSIMASQLDIPIFSDIDVLTKATQGSQIVGITGTNGKSTTTALTHHILSSKFDSVFIGGNIGTPALTLPIMSNSIYVIELSSYQLELSHELNLDVAALTNITEDHLERHKTMDEYANVKAKIFHGAKYCISCCDDDFSKKICDTLENDANSKLCEIFFDNNPIMKRELRSYTDLPGDHNLQNVAIAIEICRWFGMSEYEIANAARTFKGLAHRLEFVNKIDEITFINDSKATNADSLIKALLSFQGSQIFLIAGGRPKKDGIAPAVKYMNDVSETFLIGEARERFAAELAQYNGKVSNSANLEEAVKKAFQSAKRSEIAGKPQIILLSPACASFDQFENFEARGNEFKRLVSILYTP